MESKPGFESVLGDVMTLSALTRVIRFLSIQPHYRGISNRCLHQRANSTMSDAVGKERKVEENVAVEGANEEVTVGTRGVGALKPPIPYLEKFFTCLQVGSSPASKVLLGRERRLLTSVGHLFRTPVIQLTTPMDTLLFA